MDLCLKCGRMTAERDQYNGRIVCHSKDCLYEEGAVIRSFVGCVCAREGLLLGGVSLVESSRFAEWKDVVKWCDTVIEENQKAGRMPLYGGIRASTKDPEIPSQT